LPPTHLTLACACFPFASLLSAANIGCVMNMRPTAVAKTAPVSFSLFIAISFLFAALRAAAHVADSFARLAS
jgi:hypothetical protein